jgi:Tfp pilus assembly protein PilO
MPAGELNEKQLMLITVGVAAALVVGLGIALVLGYYRLSNLQQVHEQEEAKRKALNEEVEGIGELETKLDDLENRAENIFKMLPTQADIHKLMREIARKSEITGLHIKKTEVDPKAGEVGDRIKIAYDWEFLGSFHEIAKFVNHVEDKMERFLEIEEMTIEAANNGLRPGVKGAEGHLFTVRMITYQYNEEPAANAQQ